MQSFLDRIPFADKVKLAAGALAVLMICTAFVYKAQVTAAVAEQNAIGLTSVRSEIAEIRTRATGNTSNIERVSKNLEQTSVILTALLDRVQAHEVHDAADSAALKHLEQDVDRIKDGR